MRYFGLIAILIQLALSLPVRGDDIQDLSNPDVYTRLNAFYNLIDGASQASLSAEPLRSALVGLLDTEVKNFVIEPTASDDLTLGDYFSDVIAVVVRLQDPRSIASLASVMDTGNLVINSLVGFGTAAVGVVISHTTDSEEVDRGVAMITLTRMISPTSANRVTDAVSLQSIRQTFVKGEGDSDPLVAGLAETGIATLVSPTGIPGDVNGDGKVDCTDLDLVRASLGKKATDSAFNVYADVNSDGVVNVKDLAFVSQQLPSGTVCK